MMCLWAQMNQFSDRIYRRGPTHVSSGPANAHSPTRSRWFPANASAANQKNDLKTWTYWEANRAADFFTGWVKRFPLSSHIFQDILFALLGIIEEDIKKVIFPVLFSNRYSDHLHIVQTKKKNLNLPFAATASDSVDFIIHGSSKFQIRKQAPQRNFRRGVKSKIGAMPTSPFWWEFSIREGVTVKANCIQIRLWKSFSSPDSLILRVKIKNIFFILLVFWRKKWIW